MKWTNEKPTVEGWYFYRGTTGPHTVNHTLVVRVSFGDGVRVRKDVALVYEGEERYSIDRMPGEWAGPIPEPEEEG
jgi:hypothetical protein